MRSFAFAVLVCIVASAANAADRLALGAQAGFAVQQPTTGNIPNSNVHLGMLELQSAAAVARFADAPRLQVISSALVAQSVRPGSRLILGSSIVLRFQYYPERPWGWYTEAGAGISSSSLHVPELSGYMQYIAVGGAGVRRRIGDGTWLTVGYRWTHFSNDGTQRPNYGLNLHTATIGILRTLR